MKIRPYLAASLFCGFFFQACTEDYREDSQTQYSSGEHLILGDNGFKMACSSVEGICANTFRRLDGKISYSYGELVAFGGDFYASPEEIYNEVEKPYLNYFRNNVNNAKNNLIKEVQTIENFLHGHSAEVYPNFDLSYAWNFPNYTDLALNNEAHFGFYNMQAYIKYHGQAIQEALLARESLVIDRSRAERLLTKAIFTNAFADHFLTDGFASGHIRNPRVQILNWTNAHNMNKRAAATLAKIIHDRDGEVRASGEHGMNVSNASGDQWLTRCDSQLFWNSSLDSPAIQIPVRAVAASVKELMEAFENAQVPDGVYAATQLVPYPSNAERSLIELFPANMSEAEYDKIMQQLAFYSRIKALSGVDKSVLRDLTQALPSIMEDLRQAVQTALIKDPELNRRLPAAYLDAYSIIQ